MLAIKLCKGKCTLILVVSVGRVSAYTIHRLGADTRSIHRRSEEKNIFGNSRYVFKGFRIYFNETVGIACEQVLRSRMRRKESGKRKEGVGEGKRRGEREIVSQALLGSLRSQISSGAWLAG